MDNFDTPFPHAFLEGEYMVGWSPKTVDELDLIKLANCIREKVDWERKMRDPTIVEKWKNEVIAMKPRINKIIEKFEYVLAELEWVLANRDSVTGIEPSTVDNTYHSDRLIEESLRQELITCVRALEDVPDSQKDWHPGSNNQVLDLVHPSLFPLVIRETPILRNTHAATRPVANVSAGASSSESYNHLMYFADKADLLSADEAGAQALAPVDQFPPYAKSLNYQWLPADVSVNEQGSVQFDSYINNLHPEHYPKLYSTLEKILGKFIPMFDKVLTSLRHPRKNRIVLPDSDWYEEVVLPDGDASDYDESDSLEKIFKPFVIPQFEAPLIPPTEVKLNWRKLQVIVKLANIHLTPDKPEYPGGVWHLEGMANERIIASGIYYYSQENITESRLNFRQAIQEPDYEQYDDTGVAVVYDLRDEEALNQNLGTIVTKESRCIGFPNTLQHQVAPFQLINPTESGHRKILVFFLVDPTVQILSSSRVPPQSRSWFLKEMDKEATCMPDLIVHKIVGMLSWPVGLEEAKKTRDLLMQERKFFVQNNNESLFERPFSLCEH